MSAIINEAKKLDIKNRINHELSLLENPFDATVVKEPSNDAISFFYLSEAMSCIYAITFAAVLNDRLFIKEYLSLGMQLTKLGDAQRDSPHFSDSFHLMFYSLILHKNDWAIATVKYMLTLSKQWTREESLGACHSFLAHTMLGEDKKASEWLDVVKKQCERKRSSYPKNIYHAMAALLAKDEDALVASLDEVLLEHHAKANHGSSYDYNHPESFYCYFAVLIALTAKLFCNIDVIDKLKHDKNVLRLKISDYTEGDDIDRKKKYDVPVDYMFFAKLKEQGFLEDLES